MRPLEGKARLFLLIAATAIALSAQPRKERLLGFVIDSSGAKIQPAGDSSSRDAVAGDLLFAGAILKAAAGHVRFLYCPDRASFDLTAGEVTVRAASLDRRQATLAARETADPCLLPELDREPEVASLDSGARAAPPPGTPPEQPTAALRGRVPEASRAAFDQLTADLARNPNDARLRFARAVLLQNAGLNLESAADLRAVSTRWPDQPSLRALLHEMENPPATGSARKGKTHALLVGISKYALLKPEYQLNYAAADAGLFRTFLKSERAGVVPDGQIVTLTDGQATLAAIRNQMNELTRRAGKDDTVVLMIAAHGVMVRGRAYVVATNSNPQDYASTGYPMAYIQRLLFRQLAPFARTLVFVDVCHSGQIGAILEPLPESAAARAAPADTAEHLGLMASQSREFAIEYKSFGGGHGAFTYFLVRGLAADESDADRDGVISAGELVDYVRTSVAKATWNRQHPKDELGMDWTAQLASVKPASFPIAGWDPVPKSVINDIVRQRSRAAQPPSAGPSSAPPEGPPDVARRITLENEGDELLLRYQEGDEIPQLKADFVNGLRAFNGALALSPDSLYLQARATFCEGRVAIFDRRFVEAQRLLERSTRLDPGAAFSFNALGIAYLEQARYFEARQAFLDAIARAPFWAYPRHNLALTLTQIGAYDDAIRTYREAIALAPQYSYLPYNLGLLYQRINRRGEAQAAYLAAKAAAPWRAEPDVALGLLAAANGDAATAETFYRQALDKRPSGQTLLSARHNLALLLAADRARVSEALALWRQNGDYLASRLSLADTLARTGNREDAVREYQAALAQNSGLTAVSIRLAAELAQLRRFPEAINALRQALVARPGSIPLLEQLAELQVAAGQFAEARETYRTALPAAKDPATIKRLRNGLRRAEKAASKGGK